jgi:predicted phage-related endonuclease
MEQLLLERFPTDGKETQIILDQLNFQHLRMLLRLKQDHQLLPKLKSIQMVQQALFHKRLMNNMKEFHNSRSHLTLETPKSLMTSKIGTTQIGKVFQEFYPMLKKNLIQIILLELLVTTMRLQTMLIYLEIHFLSKLTTELQL